MAARSTPPAKPKLLFISPVCPDAGESGTLMRAGIVLEALSRLYEVYVFVLPMFSDPSPSALGFTAAHSRAYKIAEKTVARPGLAVRLAQRFRRPPGEYAAVARQAAARARPFPDVDFDVVHVFRLYTAPLAAPFFRLPRRRRPRLHLDLDDVESVTRRRIAALYELNGAPERAAYELEHASRFGRLERRLLPRFDRVYVCSELDAGRLGLRNVSVLPNAVRIPAPPPQRPEAGPFRLLFVGGLTYYPNEDAAVHFCRDVLPLLRREAPGAFAVDIVGKAPDELHAALARLPDVGLPGAVPDLAPWYARAGAVVVPLRAGGGTRIKVLEAFAYRRPVVATSVGMEGIDALDGEHALVADTPAGLAEACLRLLRDRGLAARLADSAYGLLVERYTLEAVVRRLDPQA